MAETNAQMVAPQIARHRYINVLDYVSADDTLNCHARVQLALNEGYGKEIVFANPYNSGRTYRFLNRSDGRLYMPLKSRIIWDTGAEMDFSAWGKSGTPHPYMYAKADTNALVLDQAAGAGTRIVEVPSGQGATFKRGDAFILNSTELYTPMDGALGTIGEWLEVSNVVGDVITTTTELRFTYDSSGGTVQIHRSDEWIDLRLENPQITGAGMFDAVNTLGDRGIEISGAKRVLIDSGEITESDAHSVVVHNAQVLHINKLTCRKFEQSPSGNTRTRYNLSLVGNSRIIRVSDCDLTGGTEMISLTPSGGITGVKQHVRITGNSLNGAERSGVTTHGGDYDPQSLLIDGNQFYDCNQGADMRLGGTFNNNVVRSMGAFSSNLDCAVQLGSGMVNFSASGNDISDVLRGYFMPGAINHWQAPGNISVRGDVMRNIRAYGAFIDFNGGDGTSVDALLGHLTFKADITLAPTGSPVGFYSRGKWNKPYVDITVRSTNAIARSAFMTRATGSVLSTSGPVDPIIVTRREGVVQPAVVQYPANGVPSVKITETVFGA